MTAANFDIELQLLIDAIFLKYHYDFREYALASLKRRLRAAMARLGCRTLSQLQDRVLHEPATFPILLDFLTVPGYEVDLVTAGWTGTDWQMLVVVTDFSETDPPSSAASPFTNVLCCTSVPTTSSRARSPPLASA